MAEGTGRQPFSLNQLFGKFLMKFRLVEDTSSSDAGEERSVEGRDGALKVFLVGNDGEGTDITVDLAEMFERQEEQNMLLRKISLQLQILSGTEISDSDARDVSEENIQ